MEIRPGIHPIEQLFSTNLNNRLSDYPTAQPLIE